VRKVWKAFGSGHLAGGGENFEVVHPIFEDENPIFGDLHDRRREHPLNLLLKGQGLGEKNRQHRRLTSEPIRSRER